LGKLELEKIENNSRHFVKRSDDFGAWLEDLKGVYGAGDTPGEALKSLRESMDLYLKTQCRCSRMVKKWFL